MLGISLVDRKTIRYKTKVIGHNARQQDERRNTTIQNWRPWLERRIRGRPQVRWGDDLKKVGGLK